MGGALCPGEALCPMLLNKLPIVQVINKNTLQWFDHVKRREEESILRVVMKLKVK